MKVLLPYGEHGFQPSPREFNWCEPGEVLCLGTNFTYAKENNFVGTDSASGCTRAIVVEMDVTLDELAHRPFFTKWRLDKEAAPDDFVAGVVDTDRMVAELETLCFQAGQFPVGTVVRRSDDRLGLVECISPQVPATDGR